MDDSLPKPDTDKPEELTYEETPIIEPIKEPAAASPVTPQTSPVSSQVKPPDLLPKPPSSSSPRRGNRFSSFVGNTVLFAILFGIGMWLSTVLRQFLPTGIEQGSVEELANLPSTPTLPADPTALWTQYQVLSGATKQPFAGVSFKLPPEVLAPVCDGASCTSQGTYLPGGTRFTTSIRATSLSFMQRAIITDAAGRPFTTREATISGSPAIEYIGNFRGTTTGGYTFSQMRGFMIQATNTHTLEFNHFTPAGVVTDFAADDIMFDKILEKLVLPPGPTPSATPTLAPTATPTATTSGY
jgi:hypothetical protein